MVAPGCYFRRDIQVVIRVSNVVNKKRLLLTTINSFRGMKTPFQQT